MTEVVDTPQLKNKEENRNIAGRGIEKYSRFNPSYLYMMQQLERSTLRLLRRHGITSIRGYKILELGCGSGGILMDFIGYGAMPERLYGIDIAIDRLILAHERNPLVNLAGADGGCLPFPADTYDLVLQYTAFSSILDPNTRREAAQEMVRVLKKPDGLILWYDFWLNPTNRNTHPMTATEISSLFPGCKFNFRRITLAPPVARRVAPFSWMLANGLESLRLLNSHYLVSIQPIE